MLNQTKFSFFYSLEIEKLKYVSFLEFYVYNEKDLQWADTFELRSQNDIAPNTIVRWLNTKRRLALTLIKGIYQ